MGRMMTLTEIKAANLSDWYFEHGGRYLEEDPATAFECAIDRRHLDHYEHSKKIRKIEIRKFIDEQLLGTVIVDYLDLSYYYWCRPGEPDYLERQISHGYYRFYFESEADQVKFALNFSDIVSEKLRWQDDQVPSGREHSSRIWEPPVDRY